MEIDKSTQGTLEEQMFYRRKTLKELTGIRHDNPTDEVSGQTCNIKVKVIRLWDSINPSTDELISIDMILMDEKVFSLHI